MVIVIIRIIIQITIIVLIVVFIIMERALDRDDTCHDFGFGSYLRAFAASGGGRVHS